MLDSTAHSRQVFEISRVPEREVGHALVLVPPPPSHLVRVVEHVARAMQRPRTWSVAAVIALLAVTLLVVGAPLLSAGVAGVGMVQLAGSVMLQTRDSLGAERSRWPYSLPLEPVVALDEIAAPALRIAYASVLNAHEEIRCAMLEAEHLQPSVRGVFERCRATALAAGRLARLANPLHRYLETHDPDRMAVERERLTAQASRANDGHTIRAYANAAAARARQLDTYHALECLRDRIRARLELSHASLEAVAALVIELHVRDLEDVEQAGASVSDQLQALRDELGLLESTLAEVEWGVDWAD